MNLKEKLKEYEIVGSQKGIYFFELYDIDEEKKIITLKRRVRRTT